MAQILNEKTPEAIEIIKNWRELAKTTMVEFSAAIRTEMDKESPEIPMGLWQSGGDLFDGFCTEEVCKALAGEKHTPFVRFFGADYGGIKSNHIPCMLNNALYCKEHMENFLLYLESDTYLHTRFFNTGCQMMAQMAMGFSYGFDGAIFHTMQQFDNPNEDDAFGKAYKRECKRFEEIHTKIKECHMKGVCIHYDPFWYTVDGAFSDSPWIECISRFGIPYTTNDSSVQFWDETMAHNSSDAQIKKVLSGGLFLNGAAAKCLCERGYGEYLGVSVGEDVSKNDKLVFDLAAREVICDSYKDEIKGKNMFPAWMLSIGGNEIALDLKPTNEETQILSEIRSYKNNLVTNGMTCFENKLGGKVVVMGMTLKNNHSQTLFNYRRKQMIQKLIKWCSDEFCYVEKAPDVAIIENVSKTQSDFRELLTLINLCTDKLDEIRIHVPASLQDVSKVYLLDYEGKWNEAEYILNNDTLTLLYKLEHCEAMYVLIK